ncbi:hypothetical protein WV31_10780 [Magnetospirillum sp. ME-1]|uniref:hypothetical protein n=1 Tax=Magnetospirillum sp. ME-1 TaxID=1639348 RepID=UPI000A17ACAC|nr:hypothetical protein [Magnetospirillum sp. ME-1]ARJ66112.1 hypothetical protein WV31_10780 [Magnetospirillum sp. ME-1]
MNPAGKSGTGKRVSALADIEALDGDELAAVASGSARKRILVARRSRPLPDRIIDALALDTDVTVRLAIAAREQPLTERAIRAMAADAKQSVRSAVAIRRQDLPDDVLSSLAADDAGAVRRSVAWRPMPMPESIMSALASDADIDVRTGIAGRKLEVPDRILLALSSDRSSYVRCTVAGRGSEGFPLAEPVLASLAANADADVCKRLLEYESLPESALAILSAHERVDVRKMVAAHVMLPKHIIRLLAADTEDEVRWVVAQRKEDLEIDVLSSLIFNQRYMEIDDHSPPFFYSTYGAHWAIDREQMLPEPLIEAIAEHPRLHESLAASKQPLSERILEILAASIDECARAAISRRGRLLPERMIIALAGDEALGVRAALAQQEDLPEQVFLALATDVEDYVRYFIATNRHAPFKAIARLFAAESLREPPCGDRQEERAETIREWLDARISRYNAQERLDFDLLVEETKAELQAAAKAGARSSQRS